MKKAHSQDTHARVEQYRGLSALLNTWEEQSSEVRSAEREYILRLRARVRQVRYYILHRADPAANI